MILTDLQNSVVIGNPKLILGRNQQVNTLALRLTTLAHSMVCARQRAN